MENRQIKAKLELSEQRFQSFVKNFDGVAFQMDAMGYLQLLEGTIEETTGYPKDEFLSGYVSLETIIHPDDRQHYQADTRHLLTQPGFRCDSLFRIIRKDGHIRWLHAIQHNICTPKKEILHIQGSLYDITYLKSAQDELARTEQKWRTIITKAPVIISVIDSAGKFLFINKTHPPKKPAELIGTDASEFLAPGDLQSKKNALSRVSRGGETIRFESSIPISSTQSEWMGHQISPIFWDNATDAALVVSTIITERKWLEQSLRTSEEQYRAIITASGDGIIILNPKGVITFGSPRVYEIFRIDGDQPVIGINALDFIDPAFRPVAAERMKAILAGDIDADPFVYPLIRKSGERFPGELVTTPLRDASGSIVNLLVLIRDISHRKK